MSSQDALQAVETLSVSGVQLKAGSAAVASGADSLKASESSLAAMQTGISNLSDALAQLNGGASQLSAGIGQIADAGFVASLHGKQPQNAVGRSQSIEFRVTSAV